MNEDGIVFAPNWLGDAVMCLPALAALRHARPKQRWTVLARGAVASVLRLANLEWEVAELAGRRSLRVPRRAAEVIIFPNSFHSALLSWRTGARRRVGYARDGRGWLLNPAVAVPAAGSLPGHESFYYLELLRRSGYIETLPPDLPSSLRVPLQPPADRVAAWRERLGRGPHVAFHVGASFGTAKRWLPERFAALAGALTERGRQVLLVGGSADRDLARTVRMSAPRPEQIKNLAGETSLAELVALLAAVDVLVANDSGPMHVAAAVGTPVVAIFGSTNERETYPLAEMGKLRLLKAPGIECSPCKLRECPIDHRCMTRIEVAEVLNAVEEVLA